MFALLLTLIYVAFISYGLAESPLGAAWPVIRTQMDVPVSYAGIITVLTGIGTVTATLNSDRLTRKFGAGQITAAAVFIIGVAMFGYSVSGSFWVLCLFALPYGLGTGSIDAALNNYVALHYKSRYMSWLHCFWGAGAMISPVLMGYFLTNNLGWRMGFKSISIFQIILAVVLVASVPLWQKRPTEQADGKPTAALSLAEILRIKGVKHMLVAFAAACAIEATVMLWTTSYLVFARGIAAETAAKYMSVYFFGIMAGRFLSGFVADRVGDRRMIWASAAVLFLGITVLGLPAGSGREWVYICGLLVIGLGCAPIYPAVIHSTAENFGAEKSQSIIGVQMASAYLGIVLVPPVFGLIAGSVGAWLLPVFLLTLLIIMAIILKKFYRRRSG